jgi:phosphate starvation-inducible PhoH-like protein
MKSLARLYKPKSTNQETYVQYLESTDVDIVFGIGPAGTGKTLFACNAAVGRLRAGSIHKIIITRPVVSVEEDIGFLPGNLVTKMDPWTRPIFDILLEFYSQKEIDLMIHGGIIEIAPLAYMRGRTFKHAFVIADEMQNSSPNQMLMLMTRIGEGSKMVITGDLKQSDRSEDNGLRDVLGKLKSVGGIEGVGYVELDFEDVERSPIVKRVLGLYEKPVKSPLPSPKKRTSKKTTPPVPITNITSSSDWINLVDDAAIIPREYLTRDDDVLRSPFSGW